MHYYINVSIPSIRQAVITTETCPASHPLANPHQISPYERVDSQEHAYQKLERAYMAKTELAAEAAKKSTPEAAKSKGKRRVEAMEGGGEEGAEGARVGQKKGKAGRWFD